MSIFKRKWFNDGKVGQYVIDNHLGKADVAGAISNMRASAGWKIMELALEDFKDRCAVKLNAIPINAIGYDRIAAVTILEWNYKNWIDAFINELQSFEKSAQETMSDFDYL